MKLSFDLLPLKCQFFIIFIYIRQWWNFAIESDQKTFFVRLEWLLTFITSYLILILPIPNDVVSSKTWWINRTIHPIKKEEKKTIHQTTCGTWMKGVNWQCYNDTRPFVQKQTFSQCKDAYYYFNSTAQFLYMIRNVAVVQRTPSAPKMSKITIFNIPPSTRSKEISIVDSERELRKKKHTRNVLFSVLLFI